LSRRRPIRSRAFLGVGLLILAAAIVLFGRNYFTANSTSEEPIDLRDVSRWVPEAHAGRPVRLVRRETKQRSTGNKKVKQRTVAIVQTLGALSSSESASARRVLLKVLKTRQTRLDRYVRGNAQTSTEATLREAELLHSVVKLRSILSAFDSGSYYVSTNGGHTMDAPEMLTFNSGIVKDGRPAVLSVVVEKKSYTDLLAVEDHVTAMRLAALREKVYAFNAKPRSDRDSLIRKHDAIRDKPYADRSASDRGFLKTYFPTGVKILRSSSTLLVVDKG